MKQRSFYLALLLLLGLVACQGAVSRDLAQNREKWADQGIGHYRYTVQVICFCPPEVTDPVQIEVQDGRAVSMTYVDSGEPAQDRWFEQYNTIDKLLAFVDASKGADAITVAYDPTYGYPTSISIDYIKEAVDDELGLRASAFEVLP